MSQIPVTTGVRFLRLHNIPFTPHLYGYEEHGGTGRAAQALQVDEHAVIKTLVMETESRSPLIVLMHGDREVSTRELARSLGVRSIRPCDPATVTRHTGYQVGGTSPFGTRTDLPVYVEESILSLPCVYINGGKRGFLVAVKPSDILTTLHPIRVHVAVTAVR